MDAGQQGHLGAHRSLGGGWEPRLGQRGADADDDPPLCETPGWACSWTNLTGSPQGPQFIGEEIEAQGGWVRCAHSLQGQSCAGSWGLVLRRGRL